MFTSLTAPIANVFLYLQSGKDWFADKLRSSGKVVMSCEKRGKVYLMGAGCGDPELLTVKAHRLLNSADVVLVDWLVNPEIQACFAPNAEKIFVGKRRGRHSMKQSDICQLMVDKALAGNTVVRLKGGDPSIFGRLGEEADALTKLHIPFAVVPGITAASGCSAYSGIPLTHRECAQSVKFLTAHNKDGSDDLDWKHLAQEKGTLVFYMGLNKAGLIAQRLMHNGMSQEMPIAIIDQGTSDEQAVISAKLSTFEECLCGTVLKGPALVVVGDVVNKRHNINLSLLHKNSEALGEILNYA